jgi:hypothetical protein
MVFQPAARQAILRPAATFVNTYILLKMTQYFSRFGPQPANRPTITGVALAVKKIGDSWFGSPQFLRHSTHSFVVHPVP